MWAARPALRRRAPAVSRPVTALASGRRSLSTTQPRCCRCGQRPAAAEASQRPAAPGSASRWAAAGAAGLAVGGAAAALQPVARADDDFSEPFGGGAGRTVSIGAALATGVAFVAYDLIIAQQARVDRRVEAASAEAPAAPAPVVADVTKEQLDAGFTGFARYASKQGWVYTGQWKAGKRQGEGTLDKDGMTISAEW